MEDARTLRVVPVGDSAVLVDLPAAGVSGSVVLDPERNARAIEIATRVRRAGVPGVRDVVSTYHSVAVFFDPLAADLDAIAALVARHAEGAVAPPSRPPVRIPVVYGGRDGPDLDSVAAAAGCRPETVVDRHRSRTYRVFMLGFLPGFPYMGVVDPAIAVPRRATPRLRVPAGSVGIAGAQTGVYPCDAPGGWQIIGRTPLALFDAGRDRPALLSPGDEVQFVPVASVEDGAGTANAVARQVSHSDAGPTRHLSVLRPGLFTTVQDGGRWGSQHLGVPVSGAMDGGSHALANGIIGNPPDRATIEITLIGPELRFEQASRIAVAGADLGATIDGAAVPMHEPVEVSAGAVLRFGRRRTGTRAYLAVGGGIAVPPVLGSRATHPASGMGGFEGRALRAGDRVPLGDEPSRPDVPAPAAWLDDESRRVSAACQSAVAGDVRLRVLPGPHVEAFDPSVLDGLPMRRFVVSTQSDRMGFRLDADAPLPVAAGAAHMLSGVTVVGAVQVPPSGQPILLMADRQTTGGYPQIAVVITADLPLAAQLAPGDTLGFTWCTRAAALQALRERRPGDRAS